MMLLPKPVKGTHRRELLAKRAAIREAEKRVKAQVKIRDRGECRVPGCKALKQGWAWNCAHLEHKGMGGDKGLDRTQTDKLIGLCHPHHLGARSHHSGDLRIEPTTAQGTSGPCDFWLSDEQARWVFLGSN
jgi:hypothetical protein